VYIAGVFTAAEFYYHIAALSVLCTTVPDVFVGCKAVGAWPFITVLS